MSPFRKQRLKIEHPHINQQPENDQNPEQQLTLPSSAPPQRNPSARTALRAGQAPSPLGSHPPTAPPGSSPSTTPTFLPQFYEQPLRRKRLLSYFPDFAPTPSIELTYPRRPPTPYPKSYTTMPQGADRNWTVAWRMFILVVAVGAMVLSGLMFPEWIETHNLPHERGKGQKATETDITSSATSVRNVVAGLPTPNGDNLDLPSILQTGAAKTTPASLPIPITKTEEEPSATPSDTKKDEENEGPDDEKSETKTTTDSKDNKRGVLATRTRSPFSRIIPVSLPRKYKRAQDSKDEDTSEPSSPSPKDPDAGAPTPTVKQTPGTPTSTPDVENLSETDNSPTDTAQSSDHNCPGSANYSMPGYKGASGRNANIPSIFKILAQILMFKDILALGSSLTIPTTIPTTTTYIPPTIPPNVPRNPLKLPNPFKNPGGRIKDVGKEVKQQVENVGEKAVSKAPEIISDVKKEGPGVLSKVGDLLQIIVSIPPLELRNDAYETSSPPLFKKDIDQTGDKTSAGRKSYDIENLPSVLFYPWFIWTFIIFVGLWSVLLLIGFIIAIYFYITYKPFFGKAKRVIDLLDDKFDDFKNLLDIVDDKLEGLKNKIEDHLKKFWEEKVNGDVVMKAHVVGKWVADMITAPLRKIPAIGGFVMDLVDLDKRLKIGGKKGKRDGVLLNDGLENAPGSRGDVVHGAEEEHEEMDQDYEEGVLEMLKYHHHQSKKFGARDAIIDIMSTTTTTTTQTVQAATFNIPPVTTSTSYATSSISSTPVLDPNLEGTSILPDLPLHIKAQSIYSPSGVCSVSSVSSDSSSTAYPIASSTTTASTATNFSNLISGNSSSSPSYNFPAATLTAGASRLSTFPLFYLLLVWGHRARHMHHSHLHENPHLTTVWNGTVSSGIVPGIARAP